VSRITWWRWQGLCAAAGCDAERSIYEQVLRSWRSRGRRYHTLAHLEACLREFDAARGLAQFPAEVEFALWFHDAAYTTWLTDNEMRSAELAARTLSACRLDAAAVERICAGIRATQHAATRLHGDPALIVDVDLSILGQPAAVYDQFEVDVRREYWWVPKRRFRIARSTVLQSFLKRPAIYHCQHFRERYEQAAQENLRRAIATLNEQARRTT
jgi:predicted metal-dependent HD superfamily phosphohydrolase